MFGKILHDYVVKIKDAVGIDFGIADNSGNVVACTEEKIVQQGTSQIADFLQSDDMVCTQNGITLQKVISKNKVEYVVFTNSDDINRKNYLMILSINIAGMKETYDERFDKAAFIKGIMMDEILPNEIPARVRELHITLYVPRAVFILKAADGKNSYVHEVIQGLFPNRAKDIVVVIDKEHLALIKELKPGADLIELQKIASIIADTLSSELMVKAFVGIGSITDNIMDIGKSYKEARQSLVIGRIFLEDKYIYNYSSLGLGRLIYKLPDTICRLFLDEFFKEGDFDFTDSETMLTIQKFFENSLNISETSRQLFVHRNTLVYRLDKIQKLTGLDLRKFDDAITFKVAMMVKRYLDRDEESF